MADDDVTPTVEDVIAEAAYKALNRKAGEPDQGSGTNSRRWDLAFDVADAVVAAVRAMTVEQQAQLIGGAVLRAWADRRVLGPWRPYPAGDPS